MRIFDSKLSKSPIVKVWTGLKLNVIRIEKGHRLICSAQTEAPAITQPVNHPEKPWSTDYCIESFDVLSALTITEHEGAVSKFFSVQISKILEVGKMSEHFFLGEKCQKNFENSSKIVKIGKEHLKIVILLILKMKTSSLHHRKTYIGMNISVFMFFFLRRFMSIGQE